MPSSPQPTGDPSPWVTADEVHRPGPLRWVWYAFGGSLPSRHDSWVLLDTTTRTWALRHVARSLAQLAVPIAAVLVFVPGPFWIRGMAALGGLVLGLFFSLAYMPETVEHRVVRAGYPAGTATEVRHQATLAREAVASRRRREAAARRAQRYRQRAGR